MKDGICPKCDAREIYIDSNTSSESSGYAYPDAFYINNRGMHICFARYICTKCGYLEFYAEDKNLDRLSQVAAKYPRIRPKTD